MWTRGNTIGVAVAGAAVAIIVAVMVVITAVTPPSSSTWPGAITRVKYQYGLDGTGYSLPSTVEDRAALAEFTKVLERNNWTPAWRQKSTGCGSDGVGFVITFDDDSTSELRLADDCRGGPSEFSNDLMNVLLLAPTVPDPTTPDIGKVTIDRTGSDPAAAWNENLDASRADDAEKIQQIRDLLDQYGYTPTTGLPPQTTSNVCPESEATVATVILRFVDNTDATLVLPAMCDGAATGGSLGADLNALVVEWSAEGS